MFRNSFLLVLIILVSLAAASSAGIPKLINYQGMLTDNSGVPLTGSYNLTFKIWTDTTGGSSLWDETHSVPVQNGLYNVILGQMTALNLSFDQQYWFEVAVGAETMPRIRFTSVGYAYRAQNADTASVALSASTGGGWVDAGSTVRLQTSTDNVGIGTSSPNAKLEINGQNSEAGLRVAWGSIYPNLYGEFKHAGSGGLRINANAGGGWADIHFQTEGTTRMFVESAGNVGIGTTSPNSTLHVNGSLSLAYKYVNTDYTLTDSDCIIGVDVTGFKKDIYLPSAVGKAGRVYTIKVVAGAQWVRLWTSSSQTIDNYASGDIAFGLWQYITVVSNGSNWLITGKNF